MKSLGTLSRNYPIGINVPDAVARGDAPDAVARLQHPVKPLHGLGPNLLYRSLGSVENAATRSPAES